MGSTSTDGAGAHPSSVGVRVPPPLSLGELDDVPGVLGDIARERAADYADVSIPLARFDERRSAGRFEAALSGSGLSLIAEVKRGSPSQGPIAELDPVTAARAYQRGGAVALSVLTEPRHFHGALVHLADVARDVEIPAMRKEFVVHPAQVVEAAEVGAAAVLLIVAVLGERLGAYLDYVGAFGLDALVEIHDEAELDLALAAGATIVGVNNRDLSTLSIDRSTAPRLMRRARERGFTGRLVAESGYEHPHDLADVVGLADAALVGTALAREGDLEAAVRRWRDELDDVFAGIDGGDA